MINMPIIPEEHSIGGIIGSHVYGFDVSGYAPFAIAAESLMEKVLLLSPYISDKSTVTASSQITTLPGSNVLNQEPSKVWRSEGAVDQYIDITLPHVVAANAIAFSWPFESLTSSALCRWQGFASLADVGVTPAFDTNWVSVWPGPDGFKHSDPEWGFETGLARVVNEEAYRFYRFWLTDPDNTTGYLDLSRIAINRAMQFKLNPRIDGDISFIPLDIQEPNGYGQIFTDPRPYQQRQFTIVWSALNETTVRRDVMELTRLRGQAGDLYIFLNPAAVDDFHMKSMQAVFENAHKFSPTTTFMTDDDGESKMGWSFTLTLDQKL